MSNKGKLIKNKNIITSNGQFNLINFNFKLQINMGAYLNVPSANERSTDVVKFFHRSKLLYKSNI